MVDNGSYHESLANEEWLLLLETMLAKEASREYACKGNLLDCLLLQSIAGIAVRTKWQSGLITGNSIIRDLNRNGCFGDITVFRREILPDLSRKVYLLYCHQILTYNCMY